jgi:peptidylprolyl isomerase
MHRIILSIASVFTVAGIALLVHAQATQPATQPAAAAAAGAAGEKTTTPSGLTIIRVAPPEGAKNGDAVFIHYAGRLTDGTPVDSSHERGEPISLILGTGQVIKGWEEGILGMQVGEKRQLIIPPDLAYGAEGRGDKIPKNATLVFDIEMVGMQRR